MHGKPFVFQFKGHKYEYRCTEQLMMAREIAEFFGYTLDVARTWLTRLADAETKRLKLKKDHQQDKSTSMPKYGLK